MSKILKKLFYCYFWEHLIFFSTRETEHIYSVISQASKLRSTPEVFQTKTMKNTGHD